MIARSDLERVTSCNPFSISMPRPGPASQICRSLLPGVTLSPIMLQALRVSTGFINPSLWQCRVCWDAGKDFVHVLPINALGAGSNALLSMGSQPLRSQSNRHDLIHADLFVRRDFVDLVNPEIRNQNEQDAPRFWSNESKKSKPYPRVRISVFGQAKGKAI